MTTNPSDSFLHTERTFSASAQEIFSAFSTPDRLARWWGPSGFTNTFHAFAFQPGGKWSFTMHGPDGTDYANECVFREIVPNAKITIQHVVPPFFLLSITLSPRENGTHLTWTQTFENADVANRLRAVCEPSNEQNLDRLEALLAHTK